MSRFTVAGWLLSAVLLLAPQSLCADDAGQADIDKAVELQLTAQTPEDFEDVARHCEQALAKGLGDENRRFAEQLLSSTLFQRAAMLAAEVLPQPRRDDDDWKAARKSAVESVEKSLKYNPKMAEGYLLLAQLQLVAGDKPRSLEAMDKAVELLEDEPRKLASALLMRSQFQDPEKRLDDLNRAVEVDPENPSTWHARSLHYRAAKDYQKAIADIEKLRELAPENLEVLELLATVYAENTQPDKALEQYDKMIELKPELPHGHVGRARHFMQQEQPAEALKALDTAIEVAPRQPNLLLMRALARRQQKEYAEAMEDIQRVLDLVPGQTAAIRLRAQIFEDQEKYTEALSDLLLLVKEQPNELPLRGELIGLLIRDNRPRRAIEECTAALELAENHPMLLRLRGGVHISIGQHAEAIRDYDLVLAVKPDDSLVLNNLSWILATSTEDPLRDGKRALELAKRACEVTQFEAPHILSTYAAAFAEVGDWEQALHWAGQAVAKSENRLEKAETEVDKKLAQEELDHLKKELESYREKKPWREKQETQENPAPLPENGDAEA